MTACSVPGDRIAIVATVTAAVAASPVAATAAVVTHHWSRTASVMPPPNSPARIPTGPFVEHLNVNGLPQEGARMRASRERRTV